MGAHTAPHQGWIVRGAKQPPRQAVRVAAVCGSLLASLIIATPASAQLTETTPEQQARKYLERAEQFLDDSDAMAARDNPLAIDGYYATARAAWDAVWTCPESPEVLCEAGDTYAAALAGLLDTACRHGRLDGECLQVGSRWDPVRVPLLVRGHALPAGGIKAVVADPPRKDKRISQGYLRGGFGLPVVIRTVDEPPTDEQDDERPFAGGSDLTDAAMQSAERHDFLPPRQSLAATAVLRFAMPEQPNFREAVIGPVHGDTPPAVLDLVNPIAVAAVRIGGARPPLAGDLTAPLLDMLEGMPRQSSVEGFLQPFGRGDTLPRLEMLEPYVRGKIPVVFIHGLASDEGTWFDVVNELRSWPAFHRHYTPWVFHYPTGASFVQVASQLRRQLTALRSRLDPEGGDGSLSRMVLVGHSMGGLHAKLMVVEPGDMFWRAICDVPFAEVRMRPQIRRLVAPGFFFHPLPFVSRVVFIATPHGGSAWATRAVGRLASLSVQQPPEMKAIHDEIVEANPGAFHPDYEDRLPTTVDLLAPDSPMLATLRRLPIDCRVEAHTIFGTGCLTDALRDGDGVVTVAAARTPGVVSERAVKAKHTRVHHQQATIEELVAILQAHAAVP